jgi:ligand-binding SRPBCC domain-containing protein
VSRIVAEDWVPVKIERVFAFFSDPRNLPRLMPSQLLAKVEDMRLLPPESGAVSESGSFSTLVAGVGSQIEISFRLVPFLPFRGRWLAEIVRYEPVVRFQDIQRRGPTKSWRHTHEFERQSRNGVDGTVVRDIVEYELPFGILGRIADWTSVRWMMKATFRSRQKALLPLLNK